MRRAPALNARSGSTAPWDRHRRVARDVRRVPANPIGRSRSSRLRSCNAVPVRFDMGTVPEWIGGCGAAAAFLFAAGSYAYDLRSRRRTEERRQASRVDAWVDSQDWNGPAGAQTFEVTIALVNDNQVAMREAFVSLSFSGGGGVWSAGPVFPTLREKPQRLSVSVNPQDQPPELRAQAGSWVSDQDVTLDFMDGDGRHWRRSGSHVERVAD